MIALLVAAACKSPGPDLKLAETKAFRLTRPDDRFNIGIDLEIRVPASYELLPGPFDAIWHRNNDPSIKVSMDPEFQASFEQPCGELTRDTSGTTVVVSRIERPDDLTVVCEKHHDGNVVNVLWIVRLIRSVDDIIECRVRTGNHLAARFRAPALAICGSLRVLGRSPYDDWAVKELKSGKH